MGASPPPGCCRLEGQGPRWDTAKPQEHILTSGPPLGAQGSLPSAWLGCSLSLLEVSRIGEVTHSREGSPGVSPPTCASQSKALGQPVVTLLVLKWLPSPQVPHRDTVGAVHGSAGPGSAGHALRDPGAPGLRLARIHGVLRPLAWPRASAWEPG